MLDEGPTWLLLADGRRARVLLEARRGATLSELPDWAMTLSEADRIAPQDRPPRAHDRQGPARHAMDRADPHEEEEENFLKRLSLRLGEAAATGHFHHLVILAPPRALGLLRAHLPAAAGKLLRADAPKDVLDEDDAKLAERLRELLRR